jgi:hypothetical protein
LIYGALWAIGLICYDAGHRIKKHLRTARALRWAGSGLMFLGVIATAVLLVVALAALP